MAYKEGIGENGKLDDSVLYKVDTGHKLYKPAAISFMRMKNDAKKQGIDIKFTGEFSAYRPCGVKGDYLQRGCDTGFTQWCAWEKYQSGVGNLAANPTTNEGCISNHGYGIAIDISGADAQNWIRKNGVKYGWWWGEAPTESWHFTYDINRDTFLDKKDIPVKKQESSKSKKITQTIIIISLLAISGFIIYKALKIKSKRKN